MRTRAQASRDAALRRLTRVNHGLTAAAAIGAGVLTEVVAHTASAHTHRLLASSGTLGAVSSGSTATGGAGARSDDRISRSSAPTAVTTGRGRSGSRTAARNTGRPAPPVHHSATVTHPSSTAATQQSTPAPAPVVVSGGS